MRILADAPSALRSLTHAPGFAAVAILTLALGIGTSTAIFSVVNVLVLRPLPYPDGERLVRISSELRRFAATDTGVSAPELFDYQALADVFTGVAGLMPVSANVTSGDVPERVEMLLTSWNYFEVLGVAPLHGRVFVATDELPGVANLAVVSHAFWQRRLDSDPAAIGRTIVIDADPVQVVGVMPAHFQHPGRTLASTVDVWSPAGFRGGSIPPSRARRRLEGAIARIRPDVTIEEARTRLDEYANGARLRFAADYPQADGWAPRLVPLHEHLVGNIAAPMMVLLCGVGLLLLVACVNVAHLVLARSSARAQEMAVRQALGASRGRLASQLLIESALVATSAGALGLLVASWSLRGLQQLAPDRIGRIDEVPLDVTALLVASGLTLVVATTFTLVPIVHLRRVNMFRALKDGARGRGTDHGGNRTRGLLVATEVALATVLLVGAGLFIRTVGEILAVPTGFETTRILTARLTLPRPNDPTRAEYLDPERRTIFYRQVLERVSSLPGVEQATLSSQVPLGGFNAPLFLEFDGDTSSIAKPVAHQFEVSPSYFTTLGVRIVRGRGFADADRRGAEPVGIVSEAAARTFWAGRDPVGQRVRYAPDTPWITIVGVASDLRHRRLTEPPQPILYRPVEQSSDLSIALMIRQRPDAVLVEPVAQAVRSVDPQVPVHSVRAMDDILSTAVAQRVFLMRLLIVFGAIACGLALLGIYGVMAYSVAQRTREIGIRMAIGARQSDVARMVVGRGLRMTGLGVAAGIAAALALARLVESQLFGVRAADPTTLAVVLALMALVACAAAWLPARRAARVDPVVALRAD